MKNLWTPWRMSHVTGTAPEKPGCLFEPPGEAAFDKSALLLYRDPGNVVLLNRFPFNFIKLLNQQQPPTA